MTNLDPLQQQMLLYILQQWEEDISSEQAFCDILSLMLLIETPSTQPVFRMANIDMERLKGHDQLMSDYFTQNPTYGAEMFRRRFRMRKPLFERIEAAVTVNNQYFLQKQDCVGVLGLSSLQKVTSAIQMLSYDKSANELNERLRLSEKTNLKCMKEFCKIVILVFGAEYLRSPTIADMERILRYSSNRGFPGMLGSLDCMHWYWKNCPTGWAGAFTGRSRSASCILEAVATYDLWIWHSFFGMPGSCNDINVLDRSPLFANLQQGNGPIAQFTINNRRYNMYYYLTDGIYPKWPVFVQTLSNPVTEKRKYFAQRQESARKDIERCFGVLQARWSILKNPSRAWKQSTLHNVITTCIILHNMIVEDEMDSVMHSEDTSDVTVSQNKEAASDNVGRAAMPRMLATRASMRNEQAHHLL